ncbi:GNAT family N-acetyltransferase [Nocardioides sp. 1609]|uniref:GNAT family N-acetyltransferase n=1 Tax=Nocardioides sp. 1609 TaxID=2508327 RepID=UPI00106F101E|nr:GNAT family N-acetyltransferase [Nocardioides sp. 1609]
MAHRPGTTGPTGPTGPTGLTGLVDAWLDGYAVSRQLPVRRHDGVAEIEVASGGRRLEVVVTEPGPALLDATLRRLVGTDDVWVTVLTAAPWAPQPPDGVRVQVDDEVLMTLDLASLASSGDTTRAVVEEHGDRARAVILDGDGDGDGGGGGDGVAAVGWVALTGPPGSTTAVADRVWTAETHRRRGLGRDVMRSLQGWAHTRGARRGVLAASVEGQALYAGLGWRVAARMTSFAGSGDRP